MKTSVTAAFILLIFTVVATTAMAAPDRTGTGPFDANGNEVIELTVIDHVNTLFSVIP